MADCRELGPRIRLEDKAVRHMIITVDLSGPEGVVGLDDPSDCKRFHLSAQGEKDESRLARALTEAGVGRIEGGDAFISVDAIRRLAEGRVTAAWDEDFDQMLGYAKTKGWLQGDAIQAHVEWEER
jgi:hypothetical protein